MVVTELAGINFTSSLTFRGKYNPTIDYDYGDVVLRDGRVYIFNGINVWEGLGPTSLVISSPTVEEIVFQCRNCGAPTKSNGVCPYCGTINRKVKNYG